MNLISKKVQVVILILVLTIFTINFVSASGYCFLTSGKGDKVQISKTDFYLCKHTMCMTCVNSDNRWMATWNKCGTHTKSCPAGPSSTDNSNSAQLTILTVNFPFSNGSILTKQNFNLEIFTNKISSINLIDNVNGNKINLCPNCNNYKRSLTFKQGFNDISIKAISGNITLEKRISFFIDNTKPKISKTLPIPNKFVNGSFSVSYDENNVKKIELYYGLDTTSPLKVNLTCPSGKGMTCSYNLNITIFDGKTISYWFVITDIAGNVIQSKPARIMVDKTPPIIKNFNYSIDKSSLNFVFNIDEKNFDKVNYFYNNEKSKTLCSGLKNGICSNKISFKKGNHNIRFILSDKAGNSIEKNIEINL